eukprot:TRINITY_DN7478_c0_g1_i12.p1 TRINITY_DN7478_c0_g1~~TRINITY_DN7478_c0_g1_i12.p1  ORF type:complete len:223 (-),score=56.35 TRINITY_DN7478_c0_g1_i12:111-779(-)
MKRNSAETTSNSSTPHAELKTKSPNQIFTIVRIERGAESGRVNKLRVGVSSKVNFSKLTSKEQLQRFRNQEQEIQQLRRRLGKLMLSKGKHVASDLRRAIDRVKYHKYELADQKLLIENVIKGITRKAIVPNTLAYNQICTILREALKLSPLEAKHSIKLDSVEVPISLLEYEVYSKLPCTPAVFHAFLGKELECTENIGQLLRTLNVEAFAKTMNLEMEKA